MIAAGYVLVIALMLPGEPLRTASYPMSDAMACRVALDAFVKAVPTEQDLDGPGFVQRAVPAYARHAACVPIPAIGAVA